MATITVGEGQIPPDAGQQIRLTYTENEWVPVFESIPDDAEGIEAVLEPWLSDRLDLPSDPDSAVETDGRLTVVDPAYPPTIDAEYAAVVTYNADDREWVVEINDAVEPFSWLV